MRRYVIPLISSILDLLPLQDHGDFPERCDYANPDLLLSGKDRTKDDKTNAYRESYKTVCDVVNRFSNIRDTSFCAKCKCKCKCKCKRRLSTLANANTRLRLKHGCRL